MGRVGGGPRPPRASRGPGSWVPARGRGRLRAESPRLSPPRLPLWKPPHPARSALEFGSGRRSAASNTDSLLPLRMHGLGALGGPSRALAWGWASLLASCLCVSEVNPEAGVWLTRGCHGSALGTLMVAGIRAFLLGMELLGLSSGHGAPGPSSPSTELTSPQHLCHLLQDPGPQVPGPPSVLAHAPTLPRLPLGRAVMRSSRQGLAHGKQAFCAQRPGVSGSQPQARRLLPREWGAGEMAERETAGVWGRVPASASGSVSSRVGH